MSTTVVIGSNGYVGSLCASLISTEVSAKVVCIDHPNSVNQYLAPEIFSSLEFYSFSSLKNIPWYKFGKTIHIIYTVCASSHKLPLSNLSQGYCLDMQILADLYEGLNSYTSQINFTISYLSSSAVYGTAQGCIDESCPLEH